MAAFFFLVLPPPAAFGLEDSPQVLPVDPQPLVIVTKDGPRYTMVDSLLREWVARQTY